MGSPRALGPRTDEWVVRLDKGDPGLEKAIAGLENALHQDSIGPPSIQTPKQQPAVG